MVSSSEKRCGRKLGSTAIARHPLEKRSPPFGPPSQVSEVLDAETLRTMTGQYQGRGDCSVDRLVQHAVLCEGVTFPCFHPALTTRQKIPPRRRGDLGLGGSTALRCELPSLLLQHMFGRRCDGPPAMAVRRTRCIRRGARYADHSPGAEDALKNGRSWLRAAGYWPANSDRHAHPCWRRCHLGM